MKLEAAAGDILCSNRTTGLLWDDEQTQHFIQVGDYITVVDTHIPVNLDWYASKKYIKILKSNILYDLNKIFLTSFFFKKVVDF
jgi:hypothetical protein